MSVPLDKRRDKPNANTSDEISTAMNHSSLRVKKLPGSHFYRRQIFARAFLTFENTLDDEVAVVGETTFERHAAVDYHL